MAAIWRVRAGNYGRNRRDYEEEVVQLNPDRDLNANAKDFLHKLCQREGISDEKRIAYLNAFIKLLEDVRESNYPLEFSKKDIICCLRITLVSNNPNVRAATLRVLRHNLTDPGDVLIMNKLQIPTFIARSIDLLLKEDIECNQKEKLRILNEKERIQAHRLALKILLLAPNSFSPAVARSLVSLVNGLIDDERILNNERRNEKKFVRDSLFFPALFLLCKLCVLHPDLAIETTADASIFRSSTEIAQGKMNECLVGCMVFLLNRPETRRKVCLHMDRLTSGYCDLRNGDASQLAASRLSVMAALRTWTGVLFLCNPANQTGITAVINMLYLKEPDIWKAILDLFCELFGLDLEDSTVDCEDVLDIIDPCRPLDGWRLNQGFVVSEGKYMLPTFINTRTNLTEVHTALILYCVLECGLLPALIEVIVRSEHTLFAQAISLLGVVLHMAHKLLPSEVVDLSPSLPSLLQYVTHEDPEIQTRAVIAVSTLNDIHRILSRRPVPSSLFLRHIVSQGNRQAKKNSSSVGRVKKELDGNGRRNVGQVCHHLKESDLLTERDPRKWKWSYISAILKCHSDPFLSMDDVQYRILLRKLVHFYKPSSSQYCTIEYSLKDKRNEHYTTTALHFLDVLVQSSLKEECAKLLDELLTDVCRELGNLVSSSSAHECLLSPGRVYTTLSQHYFLLIGHLTTSERGLQALDRVRVLQMLLNIVETTHHDVYMKLIASSLCYSYSPMTRKILARVLTSSMESVRVYATELLLVLARCDVPQFHKWGLELLIPQIYDKHPLVANAGVDILHELCYDPTLLDCLIHIRPNLLHLGDKGHLLLIRFLSTPTGFNYLNASNFVEKELEKWENGYNYRYVGLVEGELHDSLTLHQRGEDGRYSKRLTNARHRWKPVWLPPHLYGELASHSDGFALLVNNPCVLRAIQRVHLGHCDSGTEILDLKANLWALTTMCTSPVAFEFLLEKQVVQSIVEIARNCLVLSVRATAFYCLSVISSTELGADSLAQMDWYPVRHSREALWPVVERTLQRTPRHYSEEYLSPFTFAMGDAESSEDLSPFLEFPIAHSPFMNQRASTLPPGLSGDMRHVEEFPSPSSPFKKRHQRSYSETCSLMIKPPPFQLATPQKMSLEDAAGLATLQSLHAGRRPTITSTQPFGADSEDHFLSDHCSTSPMTEFEAENPPRLFSGISDSSLSSADVVDGTTVGPTIAGPVYRGICLPKALAQYLTIVEKREERRRRKCTVSFSEMEQVKEMEEEKVPSSSSSDAECEAEGFTERRSRRPRHKAAHCVICCTKPQKSKRKRKISSGSIRPRTDTESSYGNQGEGSPISLQWRLRMASEGGSGESSSWVEGVSEVIYPPPQTLSQARLRREILKHVTRMCTVVGVWAKNLRSPLLRLKQSHPYIFQDGCLYSSACTIMSNTNCLLDYRRAIQEFFLDVTFSQFHDDAKSILDSYQQRLDARKQPHLELPEEGLPPHEQNECLLHDDQEKEEAPPKAEKEPPDPDKPTHRS